MNPPPPPIPSPDPSPHRGTSRREAPIDRRAPAAISTAGLPTAAAPTTPQDEWLWGWDPTPGIVSVWATRDGLATIWRREPGTLRLLREEERFRPWALLSTLDDLAHLGPRL